jgi:predicted O-methyltransferase YrrM
MKFNNRIQLAAHFNKLGFKVGAEVGVYQGYYSQVLCQEIPGLKLYCIDPWMNYRNYMWKRHSNVIGQAYEIAKANLAPYDCTLIRALSVDAAKDFKDNSLDFVFIDGNHDYPYVKADLEAWTPKVRKGGIVSGHDYFIGKRGNRGVVDAVDEYIKTHGYDLQVTDWCNTRIKDNRQPCWYFTK